MTGSLGQCHLEQMIIWGRLPTFKPHSPLRWNFTRAGREDAGLQGSLALPVPGRAFLRAATGRVYGSKGLLWCVRPKLVLGGVQGLRVHTGALGPGGGRVGLPRTARETVPVEGRVKASSRSQELGAGRRDLRELFKYCGWGAGGRQETPQSSGHQSEATLCGAVCCHVPPRKDRKQPPFSWHRTPE